MDAPETLTESIVRRLLSLVRYSHRLGHRMQRDYGASGRRLSVLRYLALQGEHSLGDISQHLNLRDGTTSPLLDSMVQDALVSRRRSETDCRRVLFTVTDEGAALMERAPLTLFDQLREELPGLSEGELRAIDDALARVISVAELDESLLE